MGVVSHTALSVWMQESLSQTFDAVLHEPLPPALLAILGPRTEDNADSIPGQDGAGHAGF